MSQSVQLYKINEAPHSKNKVVAWDHFILRAICENLDQRLTWAIVIFSDGEPLVRSNLKKVDKTIGCSDFEGWILNTQRNRPSATFPYTRDPDMPDCVNHIMFKKRGVLAAHLFTLRQPTNQDVNLKKVIPIRTEVIAYGE